MSTLEDAGLAKVMLTYVTGGRLRTEIVIIPAGQLDALLAQLRETGVG